MNPPARRLPRPVQGRALAHQRGQGDLHLDRLTDQQLADLEKLVAKAKADDD
jgi:uncharacterized protein YjiS (DUF1127 family)